MRNISIDKICFHDAILKKCYRNENDLILEIDDGWVEKIKYVITFKDVNIEIFNTNEINNSYIVSIFNLLKRKMIFPYSKKLGIYVYEDIDIFHGESGKYDNGRNYLKLWFDYPTEFYVEHTEILDDYNILGFNVDLVDEFDDTGRIFVKFIASEINVDEIIK